MTIKEYKLKNGDKRYMFQVYVGVDPLTGKEQRTTRRGFKTKKQAELALARIKLQIENGAYKKNKVAETFQDVFEMWFEQYKISDIEKSTIQAVEGIFKNHILPKFGKYKIDKINLKLCQEAVNEWFKNFVNYSTFKSYTSQIFQYARKHGLRDDNPMELVDMPNKGMKKTSEKVKEENFYEKDELKYFLECAAQENFMIYVAFRVLSYSGMRRGELLALTWKDINFNNKTISIEKTVTRDENGLYVTNVKNGVSRTIEMDEITMNILKEWRSKQKQVYLKLGHNTLQPKQLVFSSQDNQLVNPNMVNYWLNNILNKYDLKKITVHGLRHSHCSLLFEAGATIKEVQDRLGHTNSKTTMDIYTHVTKKARSQVVKRFADFMES